jgi:hypothetical protein
MAVGQNSQPKQRTSGAPLRSVRSYTNSTERAASGQQRAQSMEPRGPGITQACPSFGAAEGRRACSLSLQTA